MKIDSTGTAAVDPNYYWQPIDTCPIDVKVQLLGDGVAHYGVYKGLSYGFWTHWAALPVLKKD
jgi:hypothetical protein